MPYQIRLHYQYIVPETFGATLKFVVKDCDPTTGLPDCEEGYDDEYIVSKQTISFKK